MLIVDDCSIFLLSTLLFTSQFFFIPWNYFRPMRPVFPQRRVGYDQRTGNAKPCTGSSIIHKWCAMETGSCSLTIAKRQMVCRNGCLTLAKILTRPIIWPPHGWINWLSWRHCLLSIRPILGLHCGVRQPRWQCRLIRPWQKSLWMATNTCFRPIKQGRRNCESPHGGVILMHA